MIRIMDYSTVSESEIFSRSSSSADVSAPVAAIIGDVRQRGDKALIDLTRKFDGVDISRVGSALPEQVTSTFRPTRASTTER